MMKMTIAVAAIAMLAPAVVWAQPQAKKVEKKAISSYVLRAEIDGATVKTKDGNSIGEVDELIVDTTTNQVVFAIVSTGGFLGIGDRLTAIPFDLIQWRQEDDKAALWCDISKKNLEMAPKFEHDRLSEHLGNEQWRNETRAAFGTYPKDAVITTPVVVGKVLPGAGETAVVHSDRSAMKPMRFRKAGEMIDAKVLAANNSEGEKAEFETFGDVDDLIINRDNHKVVAIIISRGGVMGVNDTRYIVPSAALVQTDETDRLCVNRSMSQMKDAPVLEKTAIARLENKEYCAGLAKFYGVELGK